MEIYKTFRIDAAHRLPNVPADHRCGRIHGHSFRVEVHVRGPVDEKAGWIIDFADIKEAFQSIHDELDHRYLNEVPGLVNPTSENIARWIWQRLVPKLPGLSEVAVMESPESGCIYRGKRELESC